jgi:hypothetical protein
MQAVGIKGPQRAQICLAEPDCTLDHRLEYGRKIAE